MTMRERASPVSTLHPGEVDEDGDDATRPLVVIERRQQQADVCQYEGNLHVQLDHSAK